MKILNHQNYKDPKNVGSKAGKLFELLGQDYPVPRGFVLVSQPTDDWDEVYRYIDQIGGYPVAVRSSGTLEDLGDASFAGMYETFLNVKTSEELISAVKSCFESTQSERVKNYLASHQKKVSPEKLLESMRVFIQKMVPAVKAGVLFTLDPVLGKEEEIYIEVCEGLGERLVSGHITPSRYRWNWQENIMTHEEINDEKTSLSSNELGELSSLAINIQSFYGQPQDIEWAVDQNGKIWLLQSRPITQVAWRRDVPELTNADFKDGGVSARVCPPMMYSIYEAALQTSMGRYFQQVKLVKSGDAYQWIHYYYGRAYWNAGAVKDGLAKIPGFDEAAFDRDLGIAKDYGEKGPLKIGVNPSTLMSALNALCGVLIEYDDCRKMMEHFVPWFEEIDERLKQNLNDIQKMSNEDYWGFAREVIAYQYRTESSYFRVIYNNSNTQSDFKKLMSGFNEDLEVDVLKLLSGLEEMAHMDLQDDINSLASVARQFGFKSKQWFFARDEFLKSHYHHGDVELDLTVPRWGEVPQRIDEIVNGLIDSKQSRASRRGWIDEWERIDQANSKGILWRLWRRKSVWKQLINARDYLSRREHMRTLSTRAYYILRLVLLEGEKRLGLVPGEIHLLTIHEFNKKIIPDRSVLEYRRHIVSGYRNFLPPNEFGGALLGEQTAEATEGQIAGIGCSSGEIEAIVRVIQSIEESSQLEEGEILVTKFTDPGWTPIMSRASAVITEVGGVLSHAAVIGREYGIPAVLNVKKATSLLQTGQRARVNGRTGLITILEENP